MWRRLTMYIACMAVTLNVLGCSDEARIEKKARWLCKHGHMNEPSPEAFPSGQEPRSYVAQEDLDYLKQQDEEGSQGLGAALMPQMIRVSRGMLAGMAHHTECEVLEVDLQENGGRATVSLKQTRPDWEPDNFLKIMGELAALDTTQAIEARVDELIRTSEAPKTTERAEMTFIQQEETWVAIYELEERARKAELERERERKREKLERERARKREKYEREAERVREDLEEAREQLEQMREAQARLAKFEVREASFARKKRRFGGSQPIIEMKVANHTGEAISRAYFVGTLQSPGREVPWLEESFNYSIAGGLEPDEEASWRLAPNSFGEWGQVEAPEDAELTVEVVRLDGADGEAIAKLPLDTSRSFMEPVYLEPEALEEKVETKKTEFTKLEAQIEAIP